MVFESLVTDLLNKYLGQYVQNLDPSQLKIGIWNGDAKLENLELKSTALDDLNLPIRVIRGHLGKLCLSIPWKNLYNEPTEVCLENLYVLAKPNLGIKYDAEKEELEKLERKKKQLDNIEEARKREEEAKKKNKKKEDEQDSFAEKLATQVVKNLQVTIKNIHIRYEDSVTIPGCPFSIGVTLDGLSALTTDGNFIPKIIKENVTMIHKLVKLDNLALYWNTNDKFKELSQQDWLCYIEDGIARKGSLPGMKYILQPINANMKLKLNTKPGLDMSIPQVFMNLLMEELALRLTKSQYYSVMEILESFEMMNRNEPFRKYRPENPLKDAKREWWNYVIVSILEEDVRRRLRMWDWTYIKKHRDLCRAYKNKYKEKLSQKNPSKLLLKDLEDMEMKLNVVSITIFRQMALNELSRKKKSPEKQKGWFSSLFSSDKSNGKVPKTNKKVEELIPEKQRQEEMAKLYRAIGYSENDVITPFPKEYVAIKFFFHLKKLSVILKEDTSGGASSLDVMQFTLNDLFADISQRPSAKAFRVSAKVDTLRLNGTPNNGTTPVMVRSVQKETGANENLALVNLTFETNPLNDADVDQRVKAFIQPVEIVYDAFTVDQMLGFFRPPQDVILQDLQDKAYSTFNDLKMSSTAGLLYAMEHHSVTDVEISIKASYLIVPENGTLSSCKNMLVVDFGSLKLDSDPNQERIVTTKEVSETEAQEKCYDRFLLSLTALQILLCETNRDWNSARFQGFSPFHILLPVSFDGKLAKALVPDDPRLAQMIISGTLSKLEIDLSDKKIRTMLQLANSIPIPVPSANDEKVKPKDDILDSKPSAVGHVALVDLAAPSQLSFGDDNNDHEHTMPPDSPITHISESQLLQESENFKFMFERESSEESIYSTPPESPVRHLSESSGPSFDVSIANQVKLDLDFKVKMIKLNIGTFDAIEGEIPRLNFHIDDIESQIKICRWDLVVEAAVGRLVLCEIGQAMDGESLEILSTPKDTRMLRVNYRQCFFNGMVALGPQWILSDEAHRAMILYRDEFESTEQIIKIQFAMVYIMLHQEALLRTLDLINRISATLDYSELEPQVGKIASLAETHRESEVDHQSQLSTIEKANKSTEARELKKKMGVTNELFVRIKAEMEGVDLNICSTRMNLASAHFKGLSCQVEVKADKTQVQARMKDLQVIDCSENTVYRKIVSMDNEEVFDLEVVVFNEATKGDGMIDMDAVDVSVRLTIGRMRAVYLHKFVMELLVFLENFQISQETAEKARKVAAESTAAAVATMSDYGTRNKLNVTIQAPLIFLPVDSLSSLCLMVDLGQLKVFNKFCLLESTSSESNEYQPTITDNMVIKLTQLKLSKASLTNGRDLTAQRLLIEPMTLNLGLIRSLSIWNHEVPEIEVKGILKSVKVLSSEEDIRAVMEVMDGNFKEGLEVWQKEQKRKGKSAAFEEKDPDAEPLLDSTVDLTKVSDNDKKESKTGDVWFKTKFSFEIEDVVAEIYLKPEDMLDGEEFMEREASRGLGRFVIGHLGVFGSVLSDDTISVSVLLNTLSLDDLRPEKEGVTRMIEYHKTKEKMQKESMQKSKEQGMLELTFERNSQLDTQVEIKLQKLLLILNVEYIMVLTNVFLSAMPQAELVDEVDKSSLPSTPTHSVNMDNKSAQATLLAGSQISTTVDSAPIEHIPEMRVHVTVEDPQIVLLADAQDKNTNALFLHTLLRFTYQERYGQQQMLASITDTKIISAAFQQHKRKQTSSQVLSLSSLSLQSSAPIGGKPHMNVNTSMVSINLSPLTIKTIMACLNVVSQQQHQNDGDGQDQDLTRLWEVDDIRDAKKWYLETSDANKLSPGSMVWARNKNGDYEHGFLAQKDTHFNVFFYPKGEMKHVVKDNTSVILDKIPNEYRIRVGSNVISANSEKACFEIGRVKQIWQGKDKGAKKPLPGPSVDDGWVSLSGVPESTRYLIKTYWDDKEKWKSTSALRLLPRPNLDATPGIGSLVYARMKNGAYSRGKVHVVRDFRIHIYIFELEETIVHDTDDTSAVVLALHPRHAYMKRGNRVICFRLRGKQYHPGKVQQIQRDTDEPVYIVRFDDGETSAVRIDQMILLPLPNTDMVPSVGSFVFARLVGDHNIYQKAIVHEKNLKRITVKFLDGKKQTYNIRDFSAVLWDVDPNPADLRVGTSIIASDQEQGLDRRMLKARIHEIKTSLRKRTTYLVDFFDGRSIWTFLGKIRALPETDQTDGDKEEEQESVRSEQLVLETDGIDLLIEGYLGGQLTPLLSLNSKLYANVRNWSSNLCANASLSLEASYFNDKVAEWEPLIEPISDENSLRPIGLEVSYLTKNDNALSTAEDDAENDKEDDEDVSNVLTPMTTLKINSKDSVEMTLTKTSLGLLQSLGQVFSKAVYTEDITSEIASEKPPFVIYNMLGKDVLIHPGEVLQCQDGSGEIKLEHSQSSSLYLYSNDPEYFGGGFGRVSKYSKMSPPTIGVKVDGFHEIKDIAVKRHRSIIYDIIPINLLAAIGTKYAIVIDINAKDGQRIITIRSPLQVWNHFPMPLDILYENKHNEMKLMSTIEGNDDFCVPLSVAYHTKLFLKPAGFGYNETAQGIVWSEFNSEKTRQMFQCNNDSGQPFYIQVVCEEQKYSSSSSALERFAPKYILHCHPPVVLHNYLPSDVLYRSKGMKFFEVLKGGEHWPLFSLDVAENPVIELQIKDYVGKEWIGNFTLNRRRNSDDRSRIVLMSKEETNLDLTFGLYSVDTGGQHVTLYSPYWIVNKTGKTLEYQVCGESKVHEHDGSCSEALMLMVEGSNKKMKLRVSGCEWTSEFSVDTIGSDGSVKSVGKHGKTYEIGVGIALSYFSLTKIVTLTPLHMLSNHTKHLISLAEAEAKVAEFHNIKPGESVPFWPTMLPPKNLYLNINGTESIRFSPIPVTTLLLKMRNEIGGICVNFQEKDASSVLSFNPYFQGAAPVRIENYCPNISMVSYKQSESEKTYVLCYGQSILYTWDDPMKSYELTCGFIEANSTSSTIPLDKNGFGRMNANEISVYWVSFLDGLQRVLLFTEDFKLAYKASQEQTLRPTLEIALNLQGIGLSLADVDKRLDIAYLGIRKSRVGWEEKKQKRWKSMSAKISLELEDAYQKVLTQKSISPEANCKIAISDLEIDFDKMLITKPIKKRIRRTYHSGFSLQYIVSPNLMQIYAKINSVQIDSHIPGSTFQTILHPVEPPKSIAAENAAKPFFELSLTSKVSDKQFVNEVSYFKVLIQEMDVRIDKGFLMAIIDLFTNEERRGKEIDQYKWDMQTVLMKLADSPEFQAAQQDSRYFFDYFHLSPLKIHVSFSMTGGHALLESSGSSGAPIVNLLFQSVGVAFTEVQDVEFRLACFEVDSSLLSQQQLIDVVGKHYQHQAIKQLYVLVFGLDVLGNPFGLISGITTGAKNFFYEPYQGLIQGPEEFAAGLALGVKSLVGGTVGGAAGAVSRITGTVGKGLAALTLDDEYQQKRRQQMSQKPTNLGQGLAKGGKSLVKGLFSGVTGIVTKPVEGAKAEGAAGFFKGVGKGLLGAVARPTGGLVDMASSTFEGLKSTAGGRKQVSQLRMTRAFHADKVLRPYTDYEALGSKILMTTEKGKFSKTDTYFAHAPIATNEYIFVTDKKILLIVKGDLIYDWEAKWIIPFQSLRTDPECKSSVVSFKLHAIDTKRSMFSKGVDERTVTFQSNGVAKWFVEKVMEARTL